MLTEQEIREMKIFSKQVQMEICKMIHPLPAGHVGGSLSICDLLSVLYNKQLKYDPQNPHWEDRDWVVVSKGHSGPALYATLALKGFFPVEQLSTLNQPHTDLPSHCDRNHTKGIDMTTGSLGQGASTAAGVAYGMKMDRKSNKVYLILGDGELGEGQVWESAIFAGTKKLNNLIAFVDYNKFQLDSRTDVNEEANLGDISAKFTAFGWYAQRADGHDMKSINDAIENAKKQTEKPSAIVLDTVKGHGWSRIANTVGSHSRAISDEDLSEVLTEMQTELDSY